jgi:hypothetical protein
MPPGARVDAKLAALLLSILLAATPAVTALFCGADDCDANTSASNATTSLGAVNTVAVETCGHGTPYFASGVVLVVVGVLLATIPLRLVNNDCAVCSFLWVGIGVGMTGLGLVIAGGVLECSTEYLVVVIDSVAVTVPVNHTNVLAYNATSDEACVASTAFLASGAVLLVAGILLATLWIPLRMRGDCGPCSCIWVGVCVGLTGLGLVIAGGLHECVVSDTVNDSSMSDDASLCLDPLCHVPFYAAGAVVLITGAIFVTAPFAAEKCNGCRRCCKEEAVACTSSLSSSSSLSFLVGGQRARARLVFGTVFSSFVVGSMVVVMVVQF